MRVRDMIEDFVFIQSDSDVKYFNGLFGEDYDYYFIDSFSNRFFGCFSARLDSVVFEILNKKVING